MKKFLSAFLVIAVLLSFGVLAMGSGSSEEKTQESGKVEATTDDAALGDYKVTIDSCRLATDYEGKDIVIVKYIFENVSDDDGAAFYLAIDDKAFQNGVGLNKSYFVSDDANYSADNQSKEIKKGASLEVEVAYELNDTTTAVEVEVSELFSLTDKKITKTFTME